MSIKRDIQGYINIIGGPSKRNFVELLRAPGIQAVIIYRFGHWLLAQPLIVKFFLSPLYFLLYHRMRAKWGIEVMRGATIGKGFVISHFGGIFIASDAVIGENFAIHHDVTIGRSGGGTPTIGNNVELGPGVVIAGKVQVGNNVKMGPNAVVMRNIPDYAVVQAGPIRFLALKPSEAGKNTNPKTALNEE